MSGPAETRRPPQAPGDSGLARRTAQMIRVDHAGEYGAVAIYRGQEAVFSRAPRKARTAAEIHRMAAQEQDHLDAFDALIAERGVRPTALSPFWNAAGFALGAATALLGEKAAHACTEAVEDVIEKHYADQVAELNATGAEPELAATFARFREEELEHKATAIAEGAQDAPGHALLTGLIKAGCRAAIRICEKV